MESEEIHTKMFFSFYTYAYINTYVPAHIWKSVRVCTHERERENEPVEHITTLWVSNHNFP